MLPELAASLVAQRSWSHKMAIVMSASFICACWLRFANRHLAGYTQRLAAAAPVVLLNFAAPLLFHRYNEPVSVAFTSFLLAWLGNFKAFAAAGKRGPLALQPWTPLQFWVLYVLPIVPASPPTGGSYQRRKPRKQQHESPGTALVLFLRWLIKAAATAAVVFALALPGLPLFAKSCLYVLGLYTMLGVSMDGPAALVLKPLQLRLAPHFLPPWESRSLADFWGLHWNQAASNALRTTLYDPIVQGSLVAANHPLAPGPQAAGTGAADGGGKRQTDAQNGTSTATSSVAATQRRRSARLASAPDAAGSPAAAAATTGSRASAVAAAAAAAAAPGQLSDHSVAALTGKRPSEARRLAGMTAGFFASGVAHEMIFLYVEGTTTKYLAWLWFFTGQVLLILAERIVMRKLKAAGAVPSDPLRIAVTLAVLMAAAHWLFFLPAEVAGVPARFAESMRQSFTAVAAAPAALLAAVRGET